MNSVRVGATIATAYAALLTADANRDPILANRARRLVSVMTHTMSLFEAPQPMSLEESSAWAEVVAEVTIDMDALWTQSTRCRRACGNCAKCCEPAGKALRRRGRVISQAAARLDAAWAEIHRCELHDGAECSQCASPVVEDVDAFAAAYASPQAASPVSVTAGAAARWKQFALTLSPTPEVQDPPIRMQRKVVAAPRPVASAATAFTPVSSDAFEFGAPTPEPEPAAAPVPAPDRAEAFDSSSMPPTEEERERIRRLPAWQEPMSPPLPETLSPDIFLGHERVNLDGPATCGSTNLEVLAACAAAEAEAEDFSAGALVELAALATAAAEVIFPSSVQSVSPARPSGVVKRNRDGTPKADDAGSLVPATQLPYDDEDDAVRLTAGTKERPAGYPPLLKRPRFA